MSSMKETMQNFLFNASFGISTCYTSVNCKDITSEKFFDYMIDSGALFAWFFRYMPVGNGAAVELLPTPEQRTSYKEGTCASETVQVHSSIVKHLLFRYGTRNDFCPMTFYERKHIIISIQCERIVSMTYQIITDATADLNEELLADLPEVRIIPMHVEVGGKEYLFGPGGNIECNEFYSYLPRLWARCWVLSP